MCQLAGTLLESTHSVHVRSTVDPAVTGVDSSRVCVIVFQSPPNASMMCVPKVTRPPMTGEPPALRSSTVTSSHHRFSVSARVTLPTVEDPGVTGPGSLGLGAGVLGLGSGEVDAVGFEGWSAFGDTAFTDAPLPVLPEMVSAFSAILQALLPILPPVANLVAALAPLLVTVVNLLAPVLQLEAGFEAWVAISVVVPIIEGVVSVLTGLIDGITSVVTFITYLPSMIVSGISALGSRVSTFFSTLVSTVTTALTNGLQAVVGFST